MGRFQVSLRAKRMHVCVVTPHLPPEQAANALLPPLLARELANAGVTTEFVAHRATPAGGDDPRHHVTWVPRRGRTRIARTRAGACVASLRIGRLATGPINRAELVHLHSNGLIIEVADALARRRQTPTVITLYGTDIWYFRFDRHARFGRAVTSASHRVFYSHALLRHAQELGLAPDPSSVIYAPVDHNFRLVEEPERRALREEIAPRARRLLVTVKRLHPVAGHSDLIDAMPAILDVNPDTVLMLVGEGELRPELEARVRERGLAAHVRFAGRVANSELWRYYAAADLFVLPSHLESWGTVMLEALACGTLVIAGDTAGAHEVWEQFGGDVTLFEKANIGALAAAVSRGLDDRRRTSEATRRLLKQRFGPAGCAEEYQAIYRSVLQALPER